MSQVPLQIELRESTGRVIDVAEESWTSIRDMWPDLDPNEYPVLSGVDRDGDTVFNALQCRRAEREFERMLESDSRVPVELVRKVSAMAARCATEPGLQLWFVGD